MALETLRFFTLTICALHCMTDVRGVGSYLSSRSRSPHGCTKPRRSPVLKCGITNTTHHIIDSKLTTVSGHISDRIDVSSRSRMTSSLMDDMSDFYTRVILERLLRSNFHSCSANPFKERLRPSDPIPMRRYVCAPADSRTRNISPPNSYPWVTYLWRSKQSHVPGGRNPS